MSIHRPSHAGTTGSHDNRPQRWAGKIVVDLAGSLGGASRCGLRYSPCGLMTKAFEREPSTHEDHRRDWRQALGRGSKYVVGAGPTVVRGGPA